MVYGRMSFVSVFVLCSPRGGGKSGAGALRGSRYALQAWELDDRVIISSEIKYKVGFVDDVQS